MNCNILILFRGRCGCGCWPPGPTSRTGRCGKLLRLLGRWHCTLLVVWWMIIIAEFEVQQNQQNKAHNAPSNQKFHILHPKLILEFSRLFFKLGCTVLEC